MITAIQLEKRIADTHILSIIISKLGHWQEHYLVILFEIDKDLEVSLYCTILMFGLAVCLRVEDYRKPLFDSKEVIE